MAAYSLLVTDVTDYGSLRCVAGWDVHRHKMIRPEPYPGGFWGADRINTKEFCRGAIVEFDAVEPRPPTSYPHLTEDRVVTGAITAASKLQKKDLWELLDASKSTNLDDLFSNNLIYDGLKGFVPKDSACSSLGGIEIGSDCASVEDYVNYGGKKRLRLRFEHNGRMLAPNLTSSRSHEIYQQGGLSELNNRLKKADRVHLRIGLARAFGAQPNKCYLQINGFYMS